jgi:hypothetical protein
MTPIRGDCPLCLQEPPKVGTSNTIWTSNFAMMFYLCIAIALIAAMFRK